MISPKSKARHVYAAAGIAPPVDYPGQGRRGQRQSRVRRSVRQAGLRGRAARAFVRREDAERFVEEVRGDDPELASYLQIEERELEADGHS
jgi:hypothetical protein